MKTKTYDIVFNSNTDSNAKGFAISMKEAKSYIKNFNGTSHSYFPDYKGGSVSIVCNEDGETLYEEEVR